MMPTHMADTMWLSSVPRSQPQWLALFPGSSQFFSVVACNIEKLGGAWGTRLVSGDINPETVILCTLSLMYIIFAIGIFPKDTVHAFWTCSHALVSTCTHTY